MEEGQDSFWTPSRSPATPDVPPRGTYFTRAGTPSQQVRPRRSNSYSKVDQQHLAADVGAFKVFIERPGTGPKPVENIDAVPTLEIPIPSYKLGTPRFSLRGTPFLRNSSYTTTDEMRSSIFSQRDSSRGRGSFRAPGILSRRHSDASRQPHGVRPRSDLSGQPAAKIVRQRTAIVPEMFDELTFKPACDHPSVVRYSYGGGIKAATPARLVAEITSPTFVDYDLLSDFFLTFRTFLDTTYLLHMLIARLKWASTRDDEAGLVVRVRTFVAIRHWILNYFLDDYVVDYDLRKSFCDLINSFVRELVQDPTQAKVPVKILGELMKCWRRVCALYWDGPEFDTELGSDSPIHPGGVAGSRDPQLDPTFWDSHPEGPPRLDDIFQPDFVSQDMIFAPQPAGSLDGTITQQNIPEVQVDWKNDNPNENPPLSPTSVMSEDFVSCSFPSRTRLGAMNPSAAHPVPASSIYESSPSVAQTPKALTGKRVRPTHAHKRSASFSDSFRDNRAQQPVEKVIYKSTEILLAFPYAGSLVRGNLFPPGQAFVDVVLPSTPVGASRATTLFSGNSAAHRVPSAMSGPGMKKLLGSVRRALSTRAGSSQDSSPTQGSFPHIPPLGVRGATINRLPGTAIVPQARRRNTGDRGPMRIDLLGAEIAEDFKKAVREDAEADQEQRRREETEGRRSGASSQHGPFLHYSMMEPDATFQSSRDPERRGPMSEMTTGSQSIVIIDDTLPLPTPTMTGALPMSPSADTFTDVLMQPSGGPTPPSTPPEAPLGTPRRSSYVLGEHARRRSISSQSFEETPSLIVQSRSSRDDKDSPEHRPPARLSLYPFSSQSFKSKKSTSLRRYASYHSGFTSRVSGRSFDASTFSDPDNPERMSDVPPVPLPLRILRRRPGGDLRAVNKVEQLAPHLLHRRRSEGSLTGYSESIRSSYLLREDDSGYVDMAGSDYNQSQAYDQQLEHPTFSLGALAEASPKPNISLFSTHSSRPVMRPSFEKEAEMLARIPDDVDDDGGIESALLKLEGRFDQRRSDLSWQSQTRDASGVRNSFGVMPQDPDAIAHDGDFEGGKKHSANHVVESSMSKPRSPLADAYQPQQQPSLEPLKPTVYQPTGMRSASISKSPRSIESYNSIPLLERGLASDEHERRRLYNWSAQSVLRGPSSERKDEIYTPESSHIDSFDFIRKTESIKRIQPGQTRPSDESFLDSDSENRDDRSDLSSELSLEVISRTEYTEHDSTSTTAFPPMRAGTVVKEAALPPQPLQHPPSPPMTLVQALKLAPNPSKAPPIRERQLEQGPLPPTPEVTPTGTLNHSSGEKGAMLDPLRPNRFPEASRKTSVHLPFTLAFDSQVLAQQFTLIEKDALNEIDWKDLIEMPWKDACAEPRSWVEFLHSSEPRGVEVVIARFNLVVKWAISECVLTQDLDERVRCIIKFIHIAAQCRRYRNFSTTTQLTIALTSKEISRLTKTWAHVPASDLKTLKDLENLVTPTSNFYNLRAEMEGAGADQGCIPFVGIYTHDLLVNNERPSQIASTPTTDPLINFERCRVESGIVKNLLRLLEASQLYRFLPVEGITERCLWLASLDDEEIAKYGKMIQK